MKKHDVLGSLDEKTINLLGLTLKPGTPILVGEKNIEHMKAEHPDDFEKYGDQLRDIINNPDYVSKHPSNGSIQFIKALDDNVLVGVRATSNNVLFARTLFVMSTAKWDHYEENKYLKKY